MYCTSFNPRTNHTLCLQFPCRHSIERFHVFPVGTWNSGRAQSDHYGLGIWKTMPFVCVEKISLKKVYTGSSGHGSVGQVFATQAWGPEFNPQHLRESQAQWCTPIIPVLRMQRQDIPWHLVTSSLTRKHGSPVSTKTWSGGNNIKWSLEKTASILHGLCTHTQRYVHLYKHLCTNLYNKQTTNKYILKSWRNVCMMSDDTNCFPRVGKHHKRKNNSSKYMCVASTSRKAYKNEKTCTWSKMGILNG